jgi:hypothetical protein
MAMAPFGESRMLPTAAYTSDEVFRWEMDNFFTGWQCIGRSDEIAEPGMQRAQQVGSTSVVLARGEDGVPSRTPVVIATTNSCHAAALARPGPSPARITPGRSAWRAI